MHAPAERQDTEQKERGNKSDPENMADYSLHEITSLLGGCHCMLHTLGTNLGNDLTWPFDGTLFQLVHREVNNPLWSESVNKGNPVRAVKNSGNQDRSHPLR